jgi:hypothetical protein
MDTPSAEIASRFVACPYCAEPVASRDLPDHVASCKQRERRTEERFE